MPVFRFRCENQHEFDDFFHDRNDPVISQQTCPECGTPAKKLLGTGYQVEVYHFPRYMYSVGKTCNSPQDFDQIVSKQKKEKEQKWIEHNKQPKVNLFE